MSPVLSKEGKSDGWRYKKIFLNYEKHEESGLSCFLSPQDETDSLHLSHLSFFPFFFFWIAPEKRPDWTLSVPLCSPLCRYLCVCPSLCSSPWLALTHWSASGWKNRGTPLWVCYRRWREGDRRNEKGGDRKRERGGGREEGARWGKETVRMLPNKKSTLENIWLESNLQFFSLSKWGWFIFIACSWGQ